MDAAKEERLEGRAFILRTSNTNTQEICSLMHRQSQTGTNHLKFRCFTRLSQHRELLCFAQLGR